MSELVSASHGNKLSNEVTDLAEPVAIEVFETHIDTRQVAQHEVQISSY